MGGVKQKTFHGGSMEFSETAQSQLVRGKPVGYLQSMVSGQEVRVGLEPETSRLQVRRPNH